MSLIGPGLFSLGEAHKRMSTCTRCPRGKREEAASAKSVARLALKPDYVLALPASPETAERVFGAGRGRLRGRPGATPTAIGPPDCLPAAITLDFPLQARRAPKHPRLGSNHRA